MKNLTNLSTEIQEQLIYLTNILEKNLNDLNTSFSDEITELRNLLKPNTQSPSSLPIAITALVLSILNIGGILSYAYFYKKSLKIFPSTPTSNDVFSPNNTENK